MSFSIKPNINQNEVATQLSKSSQEALKYIKQCLLEEFLGDSQRVDYALWRLTKKQ
jgi:predicted transcriptional regulator